MPASTWMMTSVVVWKDFTAIPECPDLQPACLPRSHVRLQQRRPAGRPSRSQEGLGWKSSAGFLVRQRPSPLRSGIVTRQEETRRRSASGSVAIGAPANNPAGSSSREPGLRCLVGPARPPGRGGERASERAMPGGARDPPPSAQVTSCLCSKRAPPHRKGWLTCCLPAPIQSPAGESSSSSACILAQRTVPLRLLFPPQHTHCTTRLIIHTFPRVALCRVSGRTWEPTLD